VIRKLGERAGIDCKEWYWLGFLDAFRKLCVAPNAEMRVMFEQMCQGYVAAGIDFPTCVLSGPHRVVHL